MTPKSDTPAIFDTLIEGSMLSGVVSALLGLLVGYRDKLSSLVDQPAAWWGADIGIIGNIGLWAALGFLIGFWFPKRAIRNAVLLVMTPAVISQVANIWKHGFFPLLPFFVFLFVVYLLGAIVMSLLGTKIRERIANHSKTKPS